VNLRASCRTDLERIYPQYICNRWLGHGSAVAERHYLIDIQDEWTRATEVDDFGPSSFGVNSGDSRADQGSSRGTEEEENPVQMTGDDPRQHRMYSGSNALRDDSRIWPVNSAGQC
jgi:hypothetical protein